MEKYYTPSVDEFHNGFRYEESKSAIATASTEWDKFEYDIESELPRNCELRVKYLDQSDIEELGWVYTGRTTELWFGMPDINIQPFNLTYRSLRLSYNLLDHRLLIWGYEYSNYKPDNEEETLFLGNIKNYNELKKLMEQLGIINN